MSITIQLINPPLELPKNFINYPVFPNSGLLITAAVLEKNGYKVKVVDALFLNRKIKALLEENKKYYIGASLGEIKKRIRDTEADVIAIANPRFSEFSTMPNRGVLELFRYIKQHYTKTLTILADFYVGGFDYIRFDPEAILGQIKDIDIIDFGEAEDSLPQIVKSINQKKSYNRIKGIAYREKQKIIVNSPPGGIQCLDQLPFPAYHLIDMPNYFYAIEDAAQGGFIHEHHTKRRLLPLITSRGCLYSCIFCASYPYARAKWRGNSPEYVIKEVEHLLKKYKVEHFIFMDENMNSNVRRFKKIIDGFVKINPAFTWSVPNGLRADKLNRAILTQMQKSGFSQLSVSAESGDQLVLDKIIKKNLKLGTVVIVAKICKEINMALSIHFIIGFPGEKMRNIRKTLSFALGLYRKYNARPVVQFAAPIEGTELYAICKKNGYFIKQDSSIDIPDAIMNESVIKTADFKPADLKRVLVPFKQKIREYT